MTPRQALQRYFGYSDFRPGQASIVNSLIHGRDTLALLATGGGKSVCFQIPALITPGTTIVVSPLVSLMKDQVDALQRRGIAATFINSTLNQSEIENRLENLQSGQWKLVYLAPERLTNPRLRKIFNSISVSYLIVDEAHCISQWGHDFRPEYTQIAEFGAALNRRPTVGAFTATATPTVQQDICQSLKLIEPQIIAHSFQRENLWLETVVCRNFNQKVLILLWLLRQQPQSSTIIYALTRESVENICKLIQIFLPQIQASFYHAGLSAQQRAAVQETFLSGSIKIMVATNAFGMGINKADIRRVIHFHLPLSLEGYYQEIGRAGRDGAPADTYLLWQPQDFQLAGDLISGPTAQRGLKLFLAVQKLVQTTGCLNHFLLTYFGEQPPAGCQHCAHCLGAKTKPTLAQNQIFTGLLKFRLQLAQKYRVDPHYLAPTGLVEWLTLLQPTTEAEFLRLPGVGRGWWNQWGNDFSLFFTKRTTSP